MGEFVGLGHIQGHAHWRLSRLTTTGKQVEYWSNADELSMLMQHGIILPRKDREAQYQPRKHNRRMTLISLVALMTCLSVAADMGMGQPMDMR